MRLKDRVCVITGASSGIGAACMAAMKREGATVIGMALEGCADPEHPVIPVDVTDEGGVRDAVDSVVRRHGGIDVLVLCAGINWSGSLVETPPDVWDRLFAVNVRGLYLMLRAVIPHMQHRRRGSIIIMGSNYGIVGGRSCAAYSATKGAAVALARSLALDLAPDGIRVNCIAPGTIETPMVLEPMRTMTPEQREVTELRRKLQHPLGRIGKPEEVAGGVVYLASDEASFVTGAVLCIDGGFTAQ